VLDYNAVDSSWSGTVAYTSAGPANDVWDVSRFYPSSASSMTVTRVSTSPPPPAVAANPPSLAPVYVHGAGLPYRYHTQGVYSTSTQTFNGAPVYVHTDSGNLQWSLYRRGNGMWVIDYNDVDNRWSGTVAYSQRDQSVSLLEAVWSRSISVTDVPAGARQRTSEWLTAMGGLPRGTMRAGEPLHDEAEPQAKPDPMRLSELHEVLDADMSDLPANDTPTSHHGVEVVAADDGAGSNAGNETDVTAPDMPVAAQDVPVDSEATNALTTPSNGETLLLVASGTALVLLACVLLILILGQRRRNAHLKHLHSTTGAGQAKPVQVHCALDVASAANDVASTANDVEVFNVQIGAETAKSPEQV